MLSRVLSVMVIVFFALIPQCHAQSAAISLSIDPSVRSVGMGHATSSVFWGDEPNYWANPALLGYHSGLHYQWQEEQLIPDLADDVFFKSNRFTLGAWGVGAAFSAKPFRLDYGESQLTDSGGMVLGTFHPYEEIQSWGVGVNVIELGETVMRSIMPINPHLARHVDFSIGHMTKTVDLDFAPPGDFQGNADSKDFGVHARFTPLNSIDYPTPEYVQRRLPALASLLDQVGGLRLDFTMARSWLNYDNAHVRYPNGRSDPIAQHVRRGMGFRLVSGVPADKRSVIQGGSWLAALFTPIVSFGMTWDRNAEEHASGEVLGHYSGWEATILNVFSIRGGRVDIPQVEVVDIHSGWGLGVKLGDIAGVRWDEARRAQARGLQNTNPRGFSAFVDFVALGEWGLDR